MSDKKSKSVNDGELTYEQRRLAYFRAQLKKAEAKCVRLKRLCGSKEVGSYIAEDTRLLNNAIAEYTYYKDIVELLEQLPPRDGFRGASIGVYVPELEMPCACNDCVFMRPYEYSSIGNNLYQKGSRCMFAPEEIEDPWRPASWLVANKEEWCPLRNYCNIDNS